MATRATNDSKRDEMKTLCQKAIAAGWTQTVLAAVFGQTSFSAYANGSSMGTNALRAELKKLPAFETAEGRAFCQKALEGALAAHARAEAAMLEAKASQPMTEEAWRAEYAYSAERYPETYNYPQYVKNHEMRKPYQIDRAERWMQAQLKRAKVLSKALAVAAKPEAASTRYLVILPGSWGAGATEAEAEAVARREGGHGRKKVAKQVYRLDPKRSEAWVTEYGALAWKGERPEQIA